MIEIDLTVCDSLALCELHVLIVALVQRVFPYMELFETTIEDVKYDHDIFLPRAKPDSLGVRVLMK